jgi:hypothetical protein
MPFTARGTTQLTSTVAAETLDAWDWMRGIRPLPWTVAQMAEQLAPLPESVTADEPDVAVEDYVAARFRLVAVPMGARLDEPRGEEHQRRLRASQPVIRAFREQLHEAARRSADGVDRETP